MNNGCRIQPKGSTKGNVFSHWSNATIGNQKRNSGSMYITAHATIYQKEPDSQMSVGTRSGPEYMLNV